MPTRTARFVRTKGLLGSSWKKHRTFHPHLDYLAKCLIPTAAIAVCMHSPSWTMSSSRRFRLVLQRATFLRPNRLQDGLRMLSNLKELCPSLQMSNLSVAFPHSKPKKISGESGPMWFATSQQKPAGGILPYLNGHGEEDNHNTATRLFQKQNNTWLRVACLVENESQHIWRRQ